MSLTDGLEAYIAIILTIEFGYDYWWNTRENRIKRRKNEAKKKLKTEIVRAPEVLARTDTQTSGESKGAISESPEL